MPNGIVEHCIDEFQPGKQLIPMEWRPLLYKRLMWEVQLIIWALPCHKGGRDA